MSSPTSQPPMSTSFILSYPAPHILLVTINRPKSMNCIPTYAHWEAESIFTWFDAETSLRVAIITGAGSKAFCAGQDLIEQASFQARPPPIFARGHPPSGFAGLSRRAGKKPVVAAANGFALGGGFEICLNCDMVVASPTASFGLPEAGVGIYAAAGGLPRLVRNVGLPIASEIALTGRRLTAQEALDFHLVNRVSKTPESVVDEAVELALKVAGLSPDSVVVTRHGLREAWETGSVERATQRTSERFDRQLFEGENMKIGIRAFAMKKEPEWLPSKI
ncbi:enoyl-CoA hydratase-like protein [Calycina marina]|uniref:Enoyl-CoA hydratase-like protein n=1 Tax=Calycina marina TaxID=1763456 RepID=A0A9P7YXB3_9HELO|nr:enoyl-CoA hydratase-like protein [Calycina marina]